MDLLLSLVKWLGANVITILGLTQGISKQAAHAAQETTPNLIQDNTHNTITDLENIVYGLFALHNQLTDIKTVVDTLAVSGVPVVLPTTPPTGYGPPTFADLWNAVWNTGAAPGGIVGWTLLLAAGSEASFRQQYAAVYRADEHFDYFFQGYDDYGTAGGFFPVWDDALILSTDTLLGYVTRLNPGALGVFQNGLTTNVRVNGTDGTNTSTFMTVDDEASFQRRKAVIFGSATVAAPPVWPGLAGVTLGTPIALDMGVTISLPMDGAIIELTAVPAKQGSFSFDGFIAWRNVGALAFVDDNGQAEVAQTLAFTSAVYCPKTMAHASGVVLRASAGVTGTITPWVVV